MAPFFKSMEEFGEVKVNGAGTTGEIDDFHSSHPISPSGSSCLKHRMESKGRDPCVPKSPQHHLSLGHIPGDGSGLGGS